MSYLEPQNMKHARPHFSIALASLAIVVSGCGSLMQRVSGLEDDELYLERNEEYLTDAEYLAYAYEQAGYGQPGEDVRDGDEFNSPFGYVPQSLRGRTMLRGYMTPYGAAGFGMNPYDPYASSFYGGYNPYDPYGGSMGYGGSWGNSWGMNPYAMNSFGYNPYGYNPYGYGYNPYGYNPYGYGGWGATTWGNAGTGDVYEGGYIVMGSRTPIWSSSSINSSGTGGRLLSNREMEVEEPEEVWTIWNAAPARTSSSMPAYRPSSSSQGERSNVSSRGATESRPSQSSWSNSSRSNSSRSSSWSGSSSGSSRGSSTRGSSGTTRGSSNSSSGSSRGTSSGRSTGRSGGRQ